jgi:hypothetical protein
MEAFTAVGGVIDRVAMFLKAALRERGSFGIVFDQ